ncbi:MAG TPA: hypothetical protein VKP30_15145 [Polyangiaceae bacterium]|nr:hypothetical protein [Polyangiaceae bacterium]
MPELRDHNGIPHSDADSQVAPAMPDAVHGVDLTTYAQLMTRLASGQPRDSVLTGAGLDERSWAEVEKACGLRLAKAAQQGQTHVLLDFERAVADAQSNCPPSEPSHSLEIYAAMVAQIEQGMTPMDVCAHFGLKLRQFFELQQAWTRRIAKDAELGRKFRGMVEAGGGYHGSAIEK